MLPLISIREITHENWRETLALSVHPNQQRFVADYEPIAAIVLAKAYVRPGRSGWTLMHLVAYGIMHTTLIAVTRRRFARGVAPYFQSTTTSPARQR